MWKLIGHERAIETLRRSLEGGRLSHAYLFLGPPQVGKGSLARQLAQALNCVGEERPCGECPSCRLIASGSHPDIQVLGLLATGDSEERLRKEIGIDQIREMIRTSSLHPYQGRYRVFIIDGAERLSHEAANCLLKTLEEPPPQVVLILLALEEGLLPPTLVSRCQKLALRPVPLPLLERALLERGLESGRARLLARLSGGLPGWALRAMEDEDLLREHSERLSRLQAVARMGRAERFAWAAEVAREFARSRENVQGLLELWMGWWRDLLLAKVGRLDLITNIDKEQTLQEQAQGYTLKQIRDFLESLHSTRHYLEQNVNPRLALEALTMGIPA